MRGSAGDPVPDVRVVVRAQAAGQELGVKDVAKRPVAQVVAQALVKWARVRAAGRGELADKSTNVVEPPTPTHRQRHHLAVHLGVHPQVCFLEAVEVGEHPVGQVAGAQGVLKAVVAGAGEHQVGEAQLLQVTQALELGGVCVAGGGGASEGGKGRAQTRRA